VWAGERKDLPQLDNGETVHDPGKVHSIEITPAMRKSVLQEGQPIAENKKPTWAIGLPAVLARPQAA
jgi:hypothetical protein